MTNQEVLDSLDSLVSAVEGVLMELKEGPGGDHIVYKGSMNSVEFLREEYRKAHDVVLRKMIEREDRESSSGVG